MKLLKELYCAAWCTALGPFGPMVWHTKRCGKPNYKLTGEDYCV